MKRSIRVADCMNRDFLTLDPEMDVLRAGKLLIKHDISGAPVLDKHGRLVGMLTERDCLRVTLYAGYHGEPGGLVRDYMSPDPVTVKPDDTIFDLAERFIDNKYRRYPVLDGGRLVGLISRRDVMRAVGHHYPK